MKKISILITLLLISIVAFMAGYVFSRSLKQDVPYATPTFATDGSVSVPAFELPPSGLISDKAKNLLKLRALMPMRDFSAFENIHELRKSSDTLLSPLLATAKKTYPVNEIDDEIAGVPVRIYTPADKETKSEKILINLHGGGFSMCWESCSVLESVPIASVGGYKVVSVNYRMAPEFKHPAAIDDVVSVYSELLKTYDAESIGMFGCSAGGFLTAQSLATFTTKGIPLPGAVGIFGAGAIGYMEGDSIYLSGYIDGMFPPPHETEEEPFDLTYGYFDGVDTKSAILSPALHPEMIAKFPPSLLITGTRAFDLSNSAYTNSQLIKADVPSQLIVGEGMGHCYAMSTDLPESLDAFKATAKFFDQHLN